MSDLPVNIDSTYPDDAGQTDVQIHQAHHDAVHAHVNKWEGTGDVITLADKAADLVQHLIDEDLIDLGVTDGEDGDAAAAGQITFVWDASATRASPSGDPAGNWVRGGSPPEEDPDTWHAFEGRKWFVYPIDEDVLDPEDVPTIVLTGVDIRERRLA